MARNFTEFVANDLYRIKTNDTGTVELHHVFTDNGDGVWAVGEKNEIKQADINPHGTGTNALSAITNGTDKVVYANANTKFLVRTAVKTGDTVTGYTFELIVGYQNMAKYTGTDVKVDWVKTDSDSYVDLVYVTGTADAATPYYGLFFLTTKEDITGALKANGTAVDYYTVNGILDGVAGEYKIAGNATCYDGTATDTITSADFATMERVMVYAKVEAGMITGIWVSVTDGADLYSGTQNNETYKNLYMDVQAAATAGTTTKSGDVLKVGSVYYTVSGTPVFGTWEETCDLSAKNVWVIYDSTKQVTVSGGKVAYVAKAVYIADTAGSIIDSGAGTPAWTVEADGYAYNNTTKEIKAPAGATINDVCVKYSGTYKLTYITYDANGIGTVNTFTAGMDNTVIDTLLAINAEILLTNATGTWTIID